MKTYRVFGFKAFTRVYFAMDFRCADEETALAEANRSGRYEEISHIEEVA